MKYSEKAIVVTGDTKPFRSLLHDAGGRFNARLTNPITGGAMVGWIFSLKRQNVLETLLSGNKVRFERVTPSNFNDKTVNDFIQDPGEISADNWAQANL